MDRPRRSPSRFARHVLPVLLAFAQVVSLVGFPAFVKPSARTACGGTTCGCPTEAQRAASCCCSTPAKAVLVGEPGSCCAKPKKAESCCATTKAESCCAAKAKPADDTPRVRWVAGLFARGCKPQNPVTGLPASEPAVPPLVPAVFAVPLPVSAAVRVADARSVSRPAVPPDPPPRVVS